jgi:hypothetical protein
MSIFLLIQCTEQSISHALKTLFHFTFDSQVSVSVDQLRLATKLFGLLMQIKRWMQQEHEVVVCTAATGVRKADNFPRDRPASARASRPRPGAKV